MTNGDYYGIGETRIREAISLYDFLGLPEDHVIFLGYGDNLHTQDYHIYNAPESEVIPSQIKKQRPGRLKPILLFETGMNILMATCMRI